jgi:hypothetical protein
MDSISSKKGGETMNREQLNQGIMNTVNFLIIPIVMAIVLFLVVQPYANTPSSSVGIGNLIACLLCP